MARPIQAMTKVMRPPRSPAPRRRAARPAGAFRMPLEEIGLDDLAELLQPMEQLPRVCGEREVFSLLILQVLDLLLLRLDLFPQRLDDGIGEDVASLRGDVRGVLASAGDGADDGTHSSTADQGDDERRQNSVLEKRLSGVIRAPWVEALLDFVAQVLGMESMVRAPERTRLA